MRKLTILFAALTLSVGVWAQTEPETVRLASDVLIIDEVYDTETGNLVGWNYIMHEGQLIIRKAGKMYNVLGVEVR